MSAQHPVIAIDGPAASGKSSVARLLAERLGWRFVNTGNMYRSVTALAVEKGIDPHDQAAVANLAETLRIDFSDTPNLHVITHFEGRELQNKELNNEAVNAAVSFIARVPEVRARLVREQRSLAALGPLVMEGRDIGSVVFPNTPHKFYIDASEEVRAKRRQVQGHADAVGLRDKIDSTRTTAPLMVSDGACYIDSSDMTLEEVITSVLDKLAVAGVHPLIQTQM